MTETSSRSTETIAERRARALRERVHVKSGDFEYSGPAAHMSDAFNLHYQVEPHNLEFKVSGREIAFKGDARHVKHAERLMRQYADHCMENNAWKHEHSIGRRVLRFFKEAADLFRKRS